MLNSFWVCRLGQPDSKKHKQTSKKQTMHLKHNPYYKWALLELVDTEFS